MFELDDVKEGAAQAYMEELDALRQEAAMYKGAAPLQMLGFISEACEKDSMLDPITLRITGGHHVKRISTLGRFNNNYLELVKFFLDLYGENVVVPYAASGTPSFLTPVTFVGWGGPDSIGQTFSFLPEMIEEGFVEIECDNWGGGWHEPYIIADWSSGVKIVSTEKKSVILKCDKELIKSEVSIAGNTIPVISCGSYLASIGGMWRVYRQYLLQVKRHEQENLGVHIRFLLQIECGDGFVLNKLNKKGATMTIRNCVLAILDQLTRKGSLHNIFVTRNAFGIFCQYSHISRRSGKPKMAYPSKATAIKAAEAMGKKHGVHFSVYKCAWCDGWHIGKNVQNKIKSETNTTSPGLVFVQKPNALYESLRQYPIIDLAPVYDRGVRGRTMSGRGNNWLLRKVRDAGVKVVIDLRTADHTDRYEHNVEEAGLEYHNIPIDSKATDARQIIALFPLLFQLLDNGNFFMACAMGRHRTDIALALYYVFHPTVRAL